MTTHKEHILIIKLSAFGDFILALGAMKAIRAHYPDEHISLLTTKSFQSFGQSCGYCDDIIIDTRPRGFNITGWLNLRKDLRNRSFTRVFDLQNNDRTDLYRRFMSRDIIWHSDKNKKQHAFDRHIATLAQANIHHITHDSMDWINADISSFEITKPYILMVPGCAPQHPLKRWPAEHYTQVAQQLEKKGYHIVLIGTDADKDATAYIHQHCPNTQNLTGKTSLWQIAALARDAAAAIGNDTGPMHMIAPTGCPSLALFSGQSSPKRNAPVGASVHTMQKDIIADMSIEDVLQSLTTHILTKENNT